MAETNSFFLVTTLVFFGALVSQNLAAAGLSAYNHRPAIKPSKMSVYVTRASHDNQNRFRQNLGPIVGYPVPTVTRTAYAMQTVTVVKTTVSTVVETTIINALRDTSVYVGVPVTVVAPAQTATVYVQHVCPIRVFPEVLPAVEHDGLTPEFGELSTKEPEIEKPEIKKPVTKEPEIEKPEVKKPVTKKPEFGELSAKEPEIEKPEVKKPVTKKPEFGELSAKEPEIEKPEIKEPVTKEPEIEKPEIKKPVIIEGLPMKDPEIEVQATDEQGIVELVNEGPDFKEPGAEDPEIVEQITEKPYVHELVTEESEDKGQVHYEPDIMEPETGTKSQLKEESVDSLKVYLQDFNSMMGSLEVPKNRKKVMLNFIKYTSEGSLNRTTNVQKSVIKEQLQSLCEKGKLTENDSEPFFQQLAGFVEYMKKNVKIF